MIKAKEMSFFNNKIPMAASTYTVSGRNRTAREKRNGKRERR